MYPRRFQIMIALVLLLLLSACMPGFKRAPETVTPKEQVRFAGALRPAIMQRLGGHSTDPLLQAAVDQAVARLGVAPGGVWIANDDAPQLLTLTDGTIIVSRGALFSLEDADALAALLAHALGHQQAGHPLQALMRITAGGPPDDDSPVASWAALTSAQLLAADYSENDERVADAGALTRLAKAGIPAAALLRLLGPGHAASADVLRHPLSASRLAAATRFSASLRPEPAVAYDTTVFSAAHDALVTVRSGYEKFHQAREAEKSGDIDQALALYLQAAENASEESLLLTGLGMAYLRQDLLVPARQHLSRASHIDSNYYYSQMGLGYIALLQQDYGRALRHLQRSLKLLTTVRGGFLLAETYAALGENDQAIDYYRAVVTADDDNLSRTARARLKALEAKP